MAYSLRERKNTQIQRRKTPRDAYAADFFFFFIILRTEHVHRWVSIVVARTLRVDSRMAVWIGGRRCQEVAMPVWPLSALWRWAAQC